MSLTCEVATHSAKNGTYLRDEDGFYTWKGEKYPSVTTCLKHVGKPALLFWAADMVAKVSLEHYARWCEDGDEEALALAMQYDTLRKAPWDARDAKAAIGTSTHDVMERYAKGLSIDLDDYDADVRPYAESALAWAEDAKPTFLLTERACFNRTWNYAGTFDGIMELDGRLLILDYKTSKQTYEDHAMQLAAYRHAEFYAGDGGEELPIPKVDGGVILVVQPGRSQLREWDCGGAVFGQFANVRSLHNWKESKPKSILLNPMRRKKAEVAA